MNILPQGKGTYIVAGVGIVGTWAVYGLEVAGVIGGAIENKIAEACLAQTANPPAGSDLEALREACTKLAAPEQLSLGVALAITLGLVTALFLRRAIGELKKTVTPPAAKP